METKPVLYGGRYKLKYRGTECLNCGYQLDITDRYCPKCSQANSTKKLTLKDFIEEFFHSIIDYDARLLRTVKALMLRPGVITLEYVAGKRVSYSNPFRFLLSLAFIYFLLVSLSGDFTQLDRFSVDQSETPGVPGIPNFEIQEPRIGKEGLKGLDSADLKVLESLDSVNIKEKFNKATHLKDSTIMADPKAYVETAEGGFLSRAGTKMDAFMTVINRDTLFTFEEAVERYEFEDSRENRLAFRTAASLNRVKKQPGTFLSDLISRLPFATFFFLPIFSVFITLAYIRKKYTYTDNLVFSFHIQSLFFILLIIGYLMDSLIGLDIYWLCFIAFAVYLFAAMRRFYKQGVFKTIIKYLFLNTIFFILAFMAAIAFILGSAVTY
ncbi:DUF3667 domain-containing protein [Robiginitalea sp. SC105]|uniref:DUF3667 domain-containing protein n=1 Tax=Robiginitalea sp. SC105 TaxID=2762332 RepID=UPI00163AB8DC|nr:DUF3667 domain-containing protein [Robiginitalea sp. SC105]MBC2839029.1 DUF3667 domain-containing protein [Robiginitalea sp. SC105]